VSDFERLKALRDNQPEEFYRLMRAVHEKTVYPHPGQQVVLDSKARFRVMNCGRRWGKTVLAGKIFVSKSRKKNQMLWWVAPTYRIVKRGYAEVIKQLPDGVLEHPAPPDTHFDAGRPVVLRFKNGTRMEFYSAERPEGMLGAAVDFCVMDEAAIMPGRIWNQIVSPTLIDHKGGALMISTPRGRNWFYDVWRKGQDPLATEYESWTFTTQDNPTLPPGEADRMAADMPRMEADQEIYAKWLAAGSSVFMIPDKALQSSAIYDNGLIEDHPPAGHVFLGVDLARTNDYTVIYGTREKDRKNCYFERMQAIAWAEQRRRIGRAVRRLTQHGATGVTLMVDEGNAGSVIVEDLLEAGYDVVGVNFTTHKANMVRLLANDLERVRAYVLDDAFMDEFSDYQMTMTPAGRMQYAAPEGRHDDVVSAKMLSHWGCVNEGFGNVTLLDVMDAPTGADRRADHEPWDTDDDGEWADLVDDDDAEVELTDEEAAYEIGLVDFRRPPTPEELLLQPDVWFD
jgi:hypothetical protein